MLHRKHSRNWMLPLLAIVIVMSWRGWAVHRQSTLDRALIAAVTKDDASTTATLLAEGADPNAAERSEREANGWMEVVQHLLSGRFYKDNPATVLATAMGNKNNATIRILKQHGADVDAARRFWLTVSMDGDGEEEAITNGIRLLHEMDDPNASDSLDQAKSWVGKRVAFADGTHMPPRIIIANGVTVVVELPPSAHWPNMYRACFVGTIKSVDMERKTIYIRSQVQDYHYSYAANSG